MDRQQFTDGRLSSSSSPSSPSAWPRKRRRWQQPKGAISLALLLVVLPTLAGGGNVQLEPDSQLEAKEALLGGREGDKPGSGRGEGHFVSIAPEETEENATNEHLPNYSPAVFPDPRHFLAAFQNGAPSTQAHISLDSWERYERFKEETCRKGRAEQEEEEEFLAERPLNSTESEYFHWEENEFHRQLRDRLLPQTRDGTLHSLIGSSLLSRLDPRIFASEPRSLCKAKRHISEADERQKLAKEEEHMFQDFLINKVLPFDMFAPRRTSASNGNSTRRSEL